MDVFSLAKSLTFSYADFARSFTKLRSREIIEKVDSLYGKQRFWPEPLLQLNPHYESGGSIQQLVSPLGGLDPACAGIFLDHRAKPEEKDKTLKLRKHQEQAIGLALARKSYVVTTGTGSGKSLCFFIPIIDAILKARKTDKKPKTRAIIIYPMNALANSQIEELKKFLKDAPASAKVSFGRYTGQESHDERIAIKKDPPDILLTNFMMLELLMTRQSELDRTVIENCRHLQFVVLDELHTYRGRQGADVAMLMRRLRARVGDPNHPPLCIGTSATMASEGGEEERNRLVSEVASKLFGTTIDKDAVVTETLRRATDPNRSAQQGLPGLSDAVLRAGTPGSYSGLSNAQIANDDLAIWIETQLGLQDVEKKPRRAHPLSVQKAIQQLAEDSGCSRTESEAALRNSLLEFSQTEKVRGVTGGADEPLFAFKLHQFISGAGRLYMTLDPAGQRTITFDGQIFDPEHPEKRLYSTHFCRNCGQEHHPVTFLEKTGNRLFEKREIDDIPVADEDDPEETAERWGFLMPEPVDGDFTFDGRDESYPESWLEQNKDGELRLKSGYRKSRAELFTVTPDGFVNTHGRRLWFMPGRFRFCPACGDSDPTSARDINRLASLSAEGRSSATTILIATILQWMNRPENSIPPITRKLLAFTDNRQDAALQAGHFNDFVFVTIIRAAILAVLQSKGPSGLMASDAAAEIQKKLGFLAANKERRTEWLYEPNLLGAALLSAEKSLRESFLYRFWIDQRRGWRYTNPNLEQLGLIQVDYLSLDDLAADSIRFKDCPSLAKASPDERKKALLALLDTLRKGLAIETDSLEVKQIESLAARMRGVIKPPWALEDDRFLAAPVFVTSPPKARDLKPSDETMLLRGSANSSIGREIKKLTFGGVRPKPSEVAGILDSLLAAAKDYGLVTPMESPFGGPGWRILPQGIQFSEGPGNPAKGDNRFFRELYRSIAQILTNGGDALFGFEGREHTAQVDGELREFREARFRFGGDDQNFLKDKTERLKEFKEDSRFLPALFCSPTMELGVDISAMNVVYMRNIPPTPANYAQRSGRAGRSGQAALIVTYCAAQSPHDQYFFSRQNAMVDGIVVPPAIDLSNPDLVDSHLQAEWLAASHCELSSAIADNLHMTEPEKPLQPEVIKAVNSPETRQLAHSQLSAVLRALENDYQTQPPAWFSGVEPLAQRVLSNSPGRFAKAFDRWRELLAAAERQVADATARLKDYSISPNERKMAEGRQSAGNTQIKLLLRGSEGQNSDFYVYRYLATEGFLPGYNFPRLPLMAFIPGGPGGTGQRYLQRARFLALSEFGPGSLVYHEGRAYRVDRALLRDTGGGPEGMLSTFSTATCPQCGACHDGEAPEQCHVCLNALSGSHIICDLHRIDNVGTRPVERITANDEERRRQGFDLQTTFSFRDASDIRRAAAVDANGELLAAVFAPAARVRRINRGLRRRSDSTMVGFLIDPKTGYWLSEKTTVGASQPPRLQQRIVPAVEDRKNALLVRFPYPWLHDLGQDADAVVATLQHALARGVEAVYQLEEGEILVEPTPSRQDRRALLFYEAAEGGAGALSRLCQEPGALAEVARKALETMHYLPDSFAAARAGGVSALEIDHHARCVAACYRCLLSYFNQPDHEIINRQNEKALAFLLRLAFTQLTPEQSNRPAAPDWENCPPPDAEPLHIDGLSLSLIWRTARIAAVEEAEAPPTIHETLAAKGLELITLPAEPAARAASIARLSTLLSPTKPETLP
jgi:Lhr-like helicase